MVYWSRSRQELWRKGDTSGDRQFVREAYYDCDGDALLFKVEQDGRGACHTGARTCFFRALRTGAHQRVGVQIRPSREEFHALAAEHTVVPVWTELLADLETPVAAFAKLVGDGPGLPARVGRARRALEPLLVRRSRPVGHARAARRRRRRRRAAARRAGAHATEGMLAALEALLATYRAPDARRAAAAARRA